MSFKGYDLNIFHDDIGIRKVSLWFALVCLGFWVVMGFDSSPYQMLEALFQIPGLIMGTKNMGNLLSTYNSFYGKEMHWSAFVIYVLLYWGVSKNWARVGVVKTKNVVYSFAAMFLAIGVFEWFWMIGFATFQNQPWVIKWQWPQLRILLQNTVYTIFGVFAALYIWVDSHKFADGKVVVEEQPDGKMVYPRNWLFDLNSWKLWIVVVAGVAAALLWIYYPWGVQQISVTLENGVVWHSSRMFPQTLYTVNLDPAGAVNSGVWFYVENNWIHGLNTIVKALFAGITYYCFKVKKVEAT